MNLAYRDLRRKVGRMIGTAIGVGLLVTVVLAMAGIYAGLVDDATILVRVVDADLWVVQANTRGPFADASRLDPTLEARVAAVPGVSNARSYTYQIVEREYQGRPLRLALVGLSWPGDGGEHLPLIAGRPLGQAHGEMIADESLGLGLGSSLRLAGEDYRIVGVTREVLTTGGDPIAMLSIADAQSVFLEQPDEVLQSERLRRLDRLRETEIGRQSPMIEDLAVDPRWAPPALPSPSVHAVLVSTSAATLEEVREHISRWPDVSVYSSHEQEQLLLQGVVKKARMQLGIFSVILLLTSGVLIAMVVYNLAAEKSHDIAILKLLGASNARIGAMILQQAWLLGALAYGVGFGIGEVAFPYFARRIVLTPTMLWAAPLLVFLVTTLASGIGVSHALRVPVSKALEG